MKQTLDIASKNKAPSSKSRPRLQNVLSDDCFSQDELSNNEQEHRIVPSTPKKKVKLKSKGLAGFSNALKQQSED